MIENYQKLTYEQFDRYKLQELSLFFQIVIAT